MRVRLAFARWLRLIFCQRVQDLSSNPGGMLLATVNKNNNA
jgi:hypothetical protein